jgi:hypothetical protein
MRNPFFLKQLSLTLLVLAAMLDRPSFALDEFYTNGDACRSVLAVLKAGEAAPSPGALARATSTGKESPIAIQGHYLSGYDTVHQVSPTGFRDLGPVALEPVVAVHEVGSKNTLNGLLFEAAAAVADKRPDAAPRGVAKTLKEGDVDRFLDEVRSEMKAVESKAARATRAEKGNYLKPVDIGDRYKLLPLETVFYGFGGGVVGAVLGGLTHGDPMMGAKFGALAATTARVAAAMSGILPIGKKAKTTFLKPTHSYTLFDQSARNGGKVKESSILLEDPETGLRTLLNWNHDPKSLDVYSWYPKSTGRRMDWAHNRSGEPTVPEVQEPVVDPKVNEPTAPEFKPQRSLEELRELAEGILTDYRPLPLRRLNDTIPPDKIRAMNDHVSALRGAFIERDDLIDAFGPILLAKGHLLMLGPPGTAKTRFAKAVGNSIVDNEGETSFFEVPMNSETSFSELYGSHNHKLLGETGRMSRFYDEGFIGHRYAFFDEIFKAPMRVLDYLLTGLSGRRHRQHTGILKTAFGASNRYLMELFDKYGDDDTRPLLERWRAIVYVPNGFSSMENRFKLYEQDQDPVLPHLKESDLEEFRRLVDTVEMPFSVEAALDLLSMRMARDTSKAEVAAMRKYQEAQANGEVPDLPYRSFRAYSNRATREDKRLLQAVAVNRSIRSGEDSSLVARLSDIVKLRFAFNITGLTETELDARLKVVNSPYEKAQLISMKMDRKFFETNIEALNKTMSEDVHVKRVADLEFRAHKDGSDSRAITEELIDLIGELEDVQFDMKGRPETFAETHVAKIAAMERAKALLQTSVGP